MDKNTCCPICVKEFFKTSNLRRHTKKFHPESFVPIPKKQFAFTCEVCGKNFSYIRNYRSHQKMHDPNPPQNKIMKNCPLCDFLSEKKEMYGHFEKIHGIELVSEQIQFPTFEYFFTWKMSLENDSKTSYIRAYAQQTKYFEEVILFVCHRSGHHNPRKSIKKFKLNVPTKKIGGFCPASIKMMKKTDGSIKVSFMKTHIGHDDTDSSGETTTKSKMIQSRHKSSLSLSTDYIVKSDRGWQYHSEKKDGTFVISENYTNCGIDCPFKCDDCQKCIHEFSCSCRDWVIKWNMCVHIHLLCRLLNKEQERVQQEQVQQPEESNSNIDISDLIIYDPPHHQQSTTILQEVKPLSEEISIEEKNVILQEFSNLLVKCNSASLFQEIITIVGELKSRVECDEILAPVVTDEFTSQ